MRKNATGHINPGRKHPLWLLGKHEWWCNVRSGNKHAATDCWWVKQNCDVIIVGSATIPANSLSLALNFNYHHQKTTKITTTTSKCINCIYVFFFSCILQDRVIHNKDVIVRKEINKRKASYTAKETRKYKLELRQSTITKEI